MGGAWVFPGGAVDAGEGTGDAAHRAAGVREVARGGGDRAARPGRARALLALDHARGGHDPLRHALLPRRRARRTPTRSPTAARPSTSAGSPRAARSRPTSATRSCSCSRRSRRSSSSPSSRPPTSCSSGRAAARSSPSSRRSSAKVPRPASCCRANPGYAVVIVAVTGPTGRHRPRAAARARRRPARRARARHGAPASSTRPRSGLTKTEYRQGDVLDRDAVRRARRRGRRARAPRVHHRRRPRGDALDQPRGLAQRLRGRPRRAAGSSTPRPSPPTASTPTTRSR